VTFVGIVNFHFLLDEFFPLNPHCRPFRGYFFSQIWACAPLSHEIHKIELDNCYQVDNTVGSEKGGKMAGGKRAGAGEAEKKQTREASCEEDR